MIAGRNLLVFVLWSTKKLQEQGSFHWKHYRRTRMFLQAKRWRLRRKLNWIVAERNDHIRKFFHGLHVFPMIFFYSNGPGEGIQI